MKKHFWGRKHVCKFTSEIKGEFYWWYSRFDDIFHSGDWNIAAQIIPQQISTQCRVMMMRVSFFAEAERKLRNLITRKAFEKQSLEEERKSSKFTLEFTSNPSEAPLVHIQSSTEDTLSKHVNHNWYVDEICFIPSFLILPANSTFHPRSFHTRLFPPSSEKILCMISSGMFSLRLFTRSCREAFRVEHMRFVLLGKGCRFMCHSKL